MVGYVEGNGPADVQAQQLRPLNVGDVGIQSTALELINLVVVMRAVTADGTVGSRCGGGG